EHVVADRKLPIGKKLGDTLVHAFVAPADQHQTLERRQFRRHFLRKALALRRKQDDGLLRAPGRMVSCSNFARRQLHRLQTFKERLRLQDHAFAAAEWAVIHGAVPVVRELAQIVDFDLHQAHFRGPAGNTVVEWSTKEVRKNRDNVGLHLDPRPSPQRTQSTQRILFFYALLAALFSSLSGLLLLFLCRHRSIDFKHALGKPHVYLPSRCLHTLQVRFHEWHIELLPRPIGNHQQRSFTGPELHVFNAADLAAVIENGATNEVADVRPAWLKLRALLARDLQFSSYQDFRVGNR